MSHRDRCRRLAVGGVNTPSLFGVVKQPDAVESVVHIKGRRIVDASPSLVKDSKPSVGSKPPLPGTPNGSAPTSVKTMLTSLMAPMATASAAGGKEAVRADSEQGRPCFDGENIADVERFTEDEIDAADVPARGRTNSVSGV